MKAIYQLASAIAIVSLTACAGLPKSSVPSDFRKNTSTHHVLAIADPQELKAQFFASNSGAAGGGMVAGPVGMLVGSGFDRAENVKLAREADLKILPFRRMLDGFDFHTNFSSSIQSQITKTNRGNSSSIKNVAAPETFSTTDYLAKVDENYIVEIRTGYSLSPDFNVLDVGVLLSVHHNSGTNTKYGSARTVNETYIQYQSKGLNPKWRLLTSEEIEKVNFGIIDKYDKKIFSASRSSREFFENERQEELSKVSSRTKGADTPLVKEAWDSERLIAEIQRGIEQVSRLVVMHLDDQRTAQEYKELERRIPMINQQGNPSPDGLIAYEFAKFSDATVYRTSDGELYCVPSGEILQKRARFNRV